MSAHHLREALLFLALAGILVPVLQRLRVNQMLGFLVAGILFGPHGIGDWAGGAPWLALVTFQDVERIKSLAELGIVFLMFMIGLELSPTRLWSLRRDVFGTGAAQVGITASVIGLCAYLFGNPPAAAMAIGLTLAMSSTAVAIELMSKQHALKTALGQKCFAILMLQDLAVVPALILVEGLAGGGGQALAWTLLVAVAKAAATITLLYLVGRRVAKPLLSSAAVQRQPDVFVALILLMVLGIAALTAASGLSLALGALLAGLLLADTEFQYEVEIIVEPFKGLLMGLFFMAVGMAVDLRLVAAFPLLLPASVLGLLAIKAAVVALLLGGWGRLGWATALQGGLLLGQGGEFAFIILAYAVSTRLLTPEASQFLLLVVSLSMLIAPAAAAVGAALARRERAGREAAASNSEPQPAADLSGHVIIGGFGRVGRLIADVLDRQGIRYIAVERDRHLVDHARGQRHGERVFSGDAALPELLRRLGVNEAACVVLTMDDPHAALHAVGALRRHYPQLCLLARARDEKHARALKQAGATEVVSEAIESGLQLAGFALGAAGMSMGAAGFHIGQERADLLARIDDRPAV
ncbi:Kef-type potassium/proton antiporter, CPA2 family [Duganella sp. CF517]|uniref:cation:proton antiporter domain-containing protein n=1 Tax=Duganella sp. CF517 TaxID=1881038 RepID=UPI0008AB022E|nr:cation:proton antiporter [Duganella sp. CF517]SEO29843.1 Kef-type potassium/proton antiporter, CPA2 family [Duganella sp. CF517]